jgi:hypothetical protein
MILYSTTPHSLLYPRNGSVCPLLPRCTTLIICFTSSPAGLLPNRVPMDKLGIRRASAHTSFNQGLSHFMDPSHSGAITLSGPHLFQSGAITFHGPLSFRGYHILRTFSHSGAITVSRPPFFQRLSHSADTLIWKHFSHSWAIPLSRHSSYSGAILLSRHSSHSGAIPRSRHFPYLGAIPLSRHSSHSGACSAAIPLI